LGGRRAAGPAAGAGRGPAGSDAGRSRTDPQLDGAAGARHPRRAAAAVPRGRGRDQGLVVAGLAALLAWWLQGEPPQVRASVDRDRVTVGDAVTYTVQAVSRSTAPIRISVEPPAGLQLVARTERSEVSQIGGPSRTTVLELQLRALRAGRWQFAPARAVQGSATGLSAAVELQVDELPGAAMIAANPTLKRLLERAPLPGRAGQPAVGVLLSANSALVGEQVDVLTAAWFPRELRVRLRRPPTLQPPVIEGVWSYPQPVPPGIAATRNVGGTLYDLFVAHQ